MITNFKEAYKYTDYRKFLFTIIEPSHLPQNKNIRVPDEFRCNVDSMDTYTFFTVNGNFVPSQNKLPQGIFVESFAGTVRNNPKLTDPFYGKIASAGTDSLTDFNTKFATDGYYIRISKDFVSPKPIQIINILVSDNDFAAVQRNMLIVEDGAQAQILICDHTLSPVKFIMNSVTEVHLGHNANLDFNNMQNQHNSTAQVAGYYFNQESHSVLSSNFITLHAGFARNNIYARLNGVFAENFLSGLYLCDKNQHIDNFTFIDHSVPDCNSSELFKGVMDDASTAAFTGKIVVRPDAQRTNAYQSNNNLLLTNSARINSKPQLEIYADDVKCSHGATVGQLDENALFYMRQRGISPQEANILLQYAFAYEVIEKIKLPHLKEQIRSLVEKRFRGQLDKCDSCVLCRKSDNLIGC